MTEHGIIAYDLGAGMFCEECGRAKSYRLWPGTLTGCKTCDEAVTRHRCLTRPGIGDLADGQAWECRDCGSTWTPRTAGENCPDCCGECGHQVTVRRWDYIQGDRTGTAPRYKPAMYAPLRNPFPRPAYAPPAGRWPVSCHRTPGGIMVHVKPGCRCR